MFYVVTPLHRFYRARSLATEARLFAAETRFYPTGVLDPSRTSPETTCPLYDASIVIVLPGSVG